MVCGLILTDGLFSTNGLILTNGLLLTVNFLSDHTAWDIPGLPAGKG